MAEQPKEFMFVDESGDPGPNDANPIYILVGAHVGEIPLAHMRKHLAAFGYHHDVLREYKDLSWADKFTGPTLHLLESLAHMTDQGDIATTANWMIKTTYRDNGGPHLDGPGQTFMFRNFQLRLLLERHQPRKPWGEQFDLVVDRWRINIEQRRNMEDYLRGNWKLRPVIASITMVDSLYTGPIQAIDIYGRLARRVIEGGASADEQALCARLMDLKEVKRGLFHGGPYAP